MPKIKRNFICSECGYKTVKYIGRCPQCGSFDTLKEEIIEEEVKSAYTASKMTSTSLPVKLKEVKANALKRYESGIKEFDRVMGGGVVIDSVNIITAPPGTGKSTLLLDIANKFAEQGLNALYISGEESESQIKLRADRILKGKISENLYIKAECNLNHILKDIDSIKPKFVIIDSIQMIYSPDIENVPGGDKQIILCTSMLLKKAKETEEPIVMFFVGQTTKDDELRGTRELEHMVDAVFNLEAEEGSTLRVLRASKNRFGNIEEIGLFEMTDEGIKEIDNPSKYFITERDHPVTGSVITMIREGSRNIAVEIESLTESNAFSFPTRICGGLNKDFVQILIAVIDKRLKLNMKKHDVYLQVGGGLKVKDTAVGLGVVVSIYSSMKNISVDGKTVFLGEVGLTGEIKRIPNIESRLKDLERMGFEKVFIPKNNVFDLKLKKIKVIEAETIDEVIKQLIS